MKADSLAEVIVAGHICLDIIPTLEEHQGRMETLLSPGKLVNVGPAITATGGAVSNTGLALHQLGLATRLMGKVGDDLLGDGILSTLRERDSMLSNGMIVAVGEHSSYTIVINPPGIDRAFLHCPGANDTFGADDIPFSELGAARLFHFGYPPLMRRMFQNDGRELETVLRRVKERGLTTSLDMSMPDSRSESGRVDWHSLLTRVLPFVDVFLPSLPELLFMLERPLFDELSASTKATSIESRVSDEMRRSLAERLLDMGAALVALKLGDQGLYVRASDDLHRLQRMGRCGLEHPGSWAGREHTAPCFEVEVAGTTGAGDCTIAGFLAALLRGLPMEEVVTSALGVGACCCERADATSGVPSWDVLQSRVQAGWKRRPESAESLP